MLDAQGTVQDQGRLFTDSSDGYDRQVLNLRTEKSVGEELSFSDHSYEQSDPEHAKKLDRLYRKLDLRIVPPLWCLYFLSSYGSAAYGNALTMNQSVGHSLPQHLQMSSSQTSTATALDYVGVIILDLPMNLIMSRVAPQAWMSRIIISVGLVYACFAAVSTARGAVALRFFTGAVSAGVWPGMTYYISMWYPNERAISRIGYYYTAAQLSAAVAGLLAAAFQKMDGQLGYTGFQWMFLIYGCVTAAVGIVLLWWLPDRPKGLLDKMGKDTSFWGSKKFAWLKSPSPLNEEEQRLHDADMPDRYTPPLWGFSDLLAIILDVRIWPFVMMYFGVVGVGIGIENYATTIIQKMNPNFSSVTVSLLYAPIWLFDLAEILLVTPFSDLFSNNRGIIFSASTSIIIAGLFVATYAHDYWSRWGGLLICGFGLGATVPTTMGWAAHVFYVHHGDVGAAASSALVSGLGNLGSVTTTFALYTGWPEDTNYHYSNMVMVAILGVSLISALCNTLLRYFLGDFGDKSLVDVTFLRIFSRRSTKFHA